MYNLTLPSWSSGTYSRIPMSASPPWRQLICCGVGKATPPCHASMSGSFPVEAQQGGPPSAPHAQRVGLAIYLNARGQRPQLAPLFLVFHLFWNRELWFCPVPQESVGESSEEWPEALSKCPVEMVFLCWTTQVLYSSVSATKNSRLVSLLWKPFLCL